MPTSVIIRRAKPEEAEVLTALAMRSKASWGYSESFMEACRAELTLTPEKMSSWKIWVAEDAGVVAGMAALHLDGVHAELEDLFVDPPAQHKGIGRALFDSLIISCREDGATVIGLDADPNAEPIYLGLGFQTVGHSPSGSIPGRMLPRMEFRLG